MNCWYTCYDILTSVHPNVQQLQVQSMHTGVTIPQVIGRYPHFYKERKNLTFQGSSSQPCSFAKHNRFPACLHGLHSVFLECFYICPWIFTSCGFLTEREHQIEKKDKAELPFRFDTNSGCSSKTETTLQFTVRSQQVTSCRHPWAARSVIQHYEFQSIDSVAVICFDLQSKCISVSEVEAWGCLHLRYCVT